MLPDSRQRLPSGLNLASARCLPQPETGAYHLLRICIALPLVVELQARPLIRIHGLEVGSPELAVGRWLRYQQRPVGPTNSQFGVSMGQCGSVGGVGLIFTRSRILGATGNR